MLRSPRPCVSHRGRLVLLQSRPCASYQVAGFLSLPRVRGNGIYPIPEKQQVRSTDIVDDAVHSFCLLANSLHRLEIVKRTMFYPSRYADAATATAAADLGPAARAHAPLLLCWCCGARDEDGAGEEDDRGRGEGPFGRGGGGSRRDAPPGKAPPPPSPSYLANMERATRSREAALRELVEVGNVHVDGRGGAGGVDGAGGEGLGAHELFRQVRRLVAR